MKSEIDAIAEQFNVTKKFAKAILVSVAHTFAKTLVDTGEVTIPTLGTLHIITKPERKGSHPQTAAPIIIKEHKVIKFVPVGALKNAIQ